MSYRKQLALAAAANIGTIASGMTFGFSAVALPAMQTSEHVPHVSDDDASWVATMASIGMPAGCLVMGPIIDKLGRKRTLMLVNVPSVIGWFLIATASSNESWFWYQVYLGRLLTGIAVGLANTPAVVYASESLDKALRSIVITWPSIGISLGIMIVYMLGSLFQDDWRLVAGICSSVPLVALLLVWFTIPESPMWLAGRGRVQEAEFSIRRIRNIPGRKDLPDELQDELQVMITRGLQQNNSESWRDTFAFLRRPEAYKPLLIMNAFFFFQQFSGIYVVIFYAVSIIRETGEGFDGYFVTIFIGVSRLVMSIVVSYASKRCGRRKLCTASGVGLVLSTSALTVFLTLTNAGIIGPEQVKNFSWFPVASLLLSVLTGTSGFLTLPFAMIGEVFPLKIRGRACGVCTCMATVFTSIIVKLYPDMRNWLGCHNVFMFFTVMAAVGTVIMYFCLPETDGKTLDEIEEYFRSGGGKRKEKLLPVSENA
ncbi:facilitated trehalose transporter Tret1-like [Periplaneta americana]|uniref:facilitated trehalose transporter Tret1-like n=1 Tax=Periplaneta americana TaxID=6978 RepID=UPI0037E8355A